LALSLLARLTRRRNPIRTEREFAALLERQSSYIAQRCSLEYCRLRAGFDWDKLMFEDSFASGMEILRWESYGAVAGHLTIMFEGLLRPHWPGSLPELAEILVGHFAATLHRYPPPAHLPEGWAGEIRNFRNRIGQAQMAEPQRPNLIGRTAGARIFKVLPIHPRLRGHDLQLIQNNVRINMCRLHEDLRRDWDAPAVARDMWSARHPQDSVG